MVHSTLVRQLLLTTVGVRDDDLIAGRRVTVKSDRPFAGADPAADALPPLPPPTPPVELLQAINTADKTVSALSRFMVRVLMPRPGFRYKALQPLRAGAVGG